MLKIKRVYAGRESADGKRILVDRLWPRGVRKEAAGIDEWVRDLAPSDGLRKWFGHEPEKWPEFRRRYLKELAAPDKQAVLKHIAAMAAAGNVTLVYGAKDTEHNNAVVLKELLSEGIAAAV